MPKHLILVLSLLAAVILLVMLNFTTPADIGPFGVLVFFSACYVLMLGVALFLVKLFLRLAGKKMGHRGYLYAAVIAFGPIMMLLIQSLGTLTPLTIAAVVILILLVCFLIAKQK